MSKRKLLLADDSITIQKVVKLTFVDEGIEVTAVGDGSTALEKIAEISPDIVLADVHMPGLNGYQICEIIRSSEATKSLPVILLVGSFEPFDENEATRVGASAYMTKPFRSIRELVAQVFDLLAAADRDPLADVPKTDDIDSLYRESFLETVEMPVEEIVKPTFDDSGIDDEMIETSYADSLLRPESVAFDLPVEDEGEEHSGEASEDILPAFVEPVVEQESEGDLIVTAEMSEQQEETPADLPFHSPFDSTVDDDFPAIEEPEPDEDLPTVEDPEPVPVIEEPTPEYDDLPVIEDAEPEYDDLPAVQDPEPEYDGLPAVEDPEPDDDLSAIEEPARAYDDLPAPVESSPEYSVFGKAEPSLDERWADETFSFENIPRHHSRPRNLEDVDLLELPGFSDERTIEFTTPEAAVVAGSNKQIVSLSPELMEILVQKVVEKLAEKY